MATRLRGAVQDTDMGLAAFVAELDGARTVDVVIGVQQGEKNINGVDIAEYAAANEYGTTRIPERSFMRSTFDESVGEIERNMQNGYARVSEGRSSIFQILGMIGLKMETRIKEKIGSNIQPKNSPATIAKKKSSRTLIDTGALINSIRYIIRRD